MREARPWRTFRWFKGQQHYSGTYWSATMGDHVIYESRLELGRLLFADFAPEVRHIVAQPFLLKTDVDGKIRKHIPDYLLLTDDGPVVVDVKPRRWRQKPEVAFTFAWTREAVASRGWQYEVWSEPDPHVLENIRFLAGYRRDWLFDPDLVAALRTADLDGMPLGDAFRLLPECPQPLVKSAALHLLWSGQRAYDAGRLDEYDSRFGITAELPVSEWEGHDPEQLTSEEFEEVWDSARQRITARPS
ncbi:TnsA-like heteromeric transposase endonuclease subunit [Streptomyces sp. SID11233]|nr:TnsA-like heteromeric transposase endonuclease subunit [Streptomyces sp. SID11233]